MASSKPTGKKYRGGNETIDRLLEEHWPDETYYMVNGRQGRKPIKADSREEAISIYVERYRERKDSDQDTLVYPA